MNCQDYFLYLLSRQEYSARDLSIKGQKKGFSIEEIETVLNYLQQKNYQSDARLVATLISSSQGKYSKSAIKSKCWAKGIDLELFERVWDETLDLDETARLLFELKEKVMRKYHLTDLQNIDPKTKAKVWRYLQYRGFNPGELLYQWQQESEVF
jgi:regulatory protein